MSVGSGARLAMVVGEISGMIEVWCLRAVMGRVRRRVLGCVVVTFAVPGVVWSFAMTRMSMLRGAIAMGRVG